MSTRDDIARLVWIGGGGNEDAWERVRDRRPPGPEDRRPNYTDEKVAEAWTTADRIIEQVLRHPFALKDRGSE